MNEKLVELVFLLDRSGSMRGLEKDTVGGFNSMIETQRELEGEVIVSTVLFNQRNIVLHNRVDIKDVKEMKVSDFQVAGTTALLDSVGRSIRYIKRIYCDTLRENRAQKVIFVITTDGMENSSKEFTYQKLKRHIDKVQEEYDWEFLFLGANIDAIKEASKMGIHEDRAVRYRSDSRGTRTSFAGTDRAIREIRSNRSLSAEWKEEIEKDFKDGE